MLWNRHTTEMSQSVRSSKIHSFKYQRLTKLACKDIGNRKSEFVAKTQFLSEIFSAKDYLKSYIYHFMPFKKKEKKNKKKKTSNCS